MVFDTITGSGFVFQNGKLVLSFKEYLEWVKGLRVDSESLYLQGVSFSTQNMKMMRYNLLTRSITMEVS